MLTGCTPEPARPALEAAATDLVPAAGVVFDDADRTHAIDPPRRRVVSMIPAVTDLLVALGASDQLVARTRYDRGPAVAHLPSVGGGLDPEPEVLVQLRPHLVVAWADGGARAVPAQMDAWGIEVYEARIDDMAALRRHMTHLGALVGKEDAARALLADIDLGLSDLRARLEQAPRPSVAYVVSLDPPMVAGPGTFVDSIITAAGGHNVMSDLKIEWPQVSLEALVARDPDVIVLSGVAASRPDSAALAWRLPPEFLAGRADGWGLLRAGKEGRVIQVDPDAFNRPGPGVLGAARALAGLLHPGLFDPGLLRPDRVPDGP